VGFTNLMCKSYVGHCRGDELPIIEKRNDASIETFDTSSEVALLLTDSSCILQISSPSEAEGPS